MRSRRLQRGIRLFEHPVLDWGSRVHPITPLLFWAPLALAALIWGTSWLSSRSFAIVWFVLGFAVWILAEYALHRWFFHFQPRSPRLRRLHYYVHEHHHRYQERDRLLAPPLMSITIATFLFTLLYISLVSFIGGAAVAVVISGVVVGYLVYDYTHFLIHFGKPRTRWGRFLKRCHLQHHFRTPGCWFSISSPWLDFVFRTHGNLRNTGASGADQPSTGTETPFSHDDDGDYLPPAVREYERQLQTGTRHPVHSPAKHARISRVRRSATTAAQ